MIDNPRTIKHQLKWTNACFKRALLKHYWDMLLPDQRKLQLDGLQSLIFKDWEMSRRDPELNRLYIEEVLKLTTARLSIIMAAYHSGKQYRSPSTIERITTELFERAVNSETRK